MKWFVVPFAFVALILVGCDQPASPPATAATVPAYPTRAQGRLKTINLFVGNQQLVTELALSPLEVQTGMMFRTNMPSNEGMLFVFAQPHQASFWMKNTVLPLSAAYIDSEGVIREIHDLHPTNETSVVATSPEIQYVLEVNRDWFKSNNIPVGTRIATEKGSLRDTFFGRVGK